MLFCRILMFMSSSWALGMQIHGPKPLSIAKKAVVLHAFGAQVLRITSVPNQGHGHWWLGSWWRLRFRPEVGRRNIS